MTKSMTVCSFILLIVTLLLLSSSIYILTVINLKKECEKDLPRNQGCVMIFLPEKTEV